jgi:hypothetical protein
MVHYSVPTRRMVILILVLSGSPLLTYSQYCRYIGRPMHVEGVDGRHLKIKPPDTIEPQEASHRDSIGKVIVVL